jgi:hypothetical protein
MPRPTSRSGGPTGILGVNPSTGVQTQISIGGLFTQPRYIREGSNGLLYIAEPSARQSGAIISYNPSTGQQSLVASCGNINGPIALAVINGFLYVADSGRGSGANLVEINLSNAQQRLVTIGGSLIYPAGLAAAPNNSVYWADPYAGGTGAVFSINLTTGT